MSRPNHKVYVIPFICVDRTCTLTAAAEHDKRSSLGIVGTVQELNVLETEAVDSHGVCSSLEGGLGRVHVCDVRGGCISETLLAVPPGRVFLCRQRKSRLVLTDIRAASWKLLVSKDRIFLNFSNLRDGRVALAGCLGSLWNCLSTCSSVCRLLGESE